MICEAASAHNNGLTSRGVGCNISVTLSDGSFEDAQIMGNTSPKKLGFLENLIRKKEKTQSTESGWMNIFSKKAPASPKLEEPKIQSREDEEMARLIEELRLEGRSEEEIQLHLSFIKDAPAPTNTVAPPPAKSKNVVSQFFSEIQQAFREITFVDAPYPLSSGFSEEDLRGYTINISTAPFYGAFPPEMDMTYEELASLEPVYVGAKCVNNLPSCKHDGSPLPGDQTNCTVCLGEFAEGEELKSLPCVHFFHKDCIDTWLMVGHTCPVCKTLVD